MITQAELHKALHYNEKTGNFTWKVCNSKRPRIKEFAGYKREDGYIFIRIENKLYRAHRLAWLYVYGTIPVDEIDHIDGNPENNAIENLRICDTYQNKYNTRLRKDNTSGVKGLHWYKALSKWQAHITTKGKTKFLGYYADFFEACCVIHSARNKLHGDFANHGR